MSHVEVLRRSSLSAEVRGPITELECGALPPSAPTKSTRSMTRLNLTLGALVNNRDRHVGSWMTWFRCSSLLTTTTMMMSMLGFKIFTSFFLEPLVACLVTMQ